MKARHETLSATFQDLRAQLFEPEWVAKLRVELREDLTGFGTGLRSAIAESQDCTISSTEQILGSLKTFSNHTHSSFNHVSQVRIPLIRRPYSLPEAFSHHQL